MTVGDTLENYWFTPMYFSEVWKTRRLIILSIRETSYYIFIKPMVQSIYAFMKSIIFTIKRIQTLRHVLKDSSMIKPLFCHFSEVWKTRRLINQVERMFKEDK